MLATALAVLAAPLAVTGFAAAGVSVGDTLDALGGVVSDDEEQARVPEGEGGFAGEDEAPAARDGQARSTGSGGTAGPSDAGDDTARNPGDDPPSESAPAPADSAPAPAAAEPAPPPTPGQPAAGEQPDPAPGPVDELNDILDNPVGGAKDVIEDVKGLIP